MRWQTQDQEGAQLRDELRQAARAWDEHGRHDDRLWTGTAFREYQLWRERYSGGLTETEESFAVAMTAHAGRRRRRRRMVVAAVLLIAATVTAATTALWRRSVLQGRLAEAQKLIALGQIRLEDFPTAALVYATQSLELADSPEARFLALEALWEGPTAFIVNETPSLFAAFSPDGDWLVQSHDSMSSLAVISRNGLQRKLDHPTESGTTRVEAFGGAGGLFPSLGLGGDLGRTALWSASEGRLLATTKQLNDFNSVVAPVVDLDSAKPRALFVLGSGDLVSVGALYVDGRDEILGEFHLTTAPGQRSAYCLDQASGDWLAVVDDNEVSVLTIGDGGLSDRRLLGRHEGDVSKCMEDPLGRFFLTVLRSGGIRRWDPIGDAEPTDLNLPPGVWPLSLSRDGSLLAAASESEDGSTEVFLWSLDETDLVLLRQFKDVRFDFMDIDPVGGRLAIRGPLPAHRLWSLAAPARARPIRLRRGPASYTHVPTFTPDGRWLATNDLSGLMMWPLERSYPAVMDSDFKAWSHGLAFGPDGRFLVTAAGSEVRVWPLVGSVPPADHLGFEAPGVVSDVAVSPDGEMFAAGAGAGPAQLWIGKDGEDPKPLASTEHLKPGTGGLTFSSDGLYVAGYDGGYDIANATIHVWEVATGEEVAEFHLAGEEFRNPLRFVSDGRLLSGSTAGVVAWDLESGEHEMIFPLRVQFAAVSGDGRRLLVTEEGKGDGMQDPAGSPTFVDLDIGGVTDLRAHGLQVMTMALDQKGTLAVTGDSEGIIRVGPVTGEEPHLLLGHDSEILSLAIDPLGRWIASASMDGTLRLWPMPDLSKPPLHTLPREELIAKLKTLTNLRVVRDEDSPTGWTLTHDPFPGWETVPTW